MYSVLLHQFIVLSANENMQTIRTRKHVDVVPSEYAFDKRYCIGTCKLVYTFTKIENLGFWKLLVRSRNLGILSHFDVILSVSESIIVYFF